MPTSNPADIRRFLMQFFDDDELTELCFDYFPEVNQEFTTGMAKGRKVQLLIAYCLQRGRMPDLMGALERERSKLYERHLSAAAGFKSHVVQQPTSKPRNRRQVFISHAHQDRSFAQQLADDLRTRGWQVWSALDSIRPGEKWVEAISRGLAESGIFVLVMTPHAVNSRWVQSETNVAIGLEHQDEMRLLPLEVESATPPPMWQAYQWISFRENYQAGLQQLFQELQPETMDQLSRLHEQLEAAVRASDWTAVQNLGAQIEALYPDYRDVASLVDQANEELCSSGRRSNPDLMNFTKKRRLQLPLASGAKALELADQILAVASAYPGIEQTVIQAQEGLRRQEREVELAQLYQYMKASIGQKDLGKALEFGERITRLNETYRDVAELIDRINEELRSQRETRLKHLYSEMQSAASAENWSNVLRLGTEISEIDGSYRDVSQQVTLARKNLRKRKRRTKDGKTSATMEAVAEPTGLASFWSSLKDRVPVGRWGILGLVVLSLLIWGIRKLSEKPSAVTNARCYRSCWTYIGYRRNDNPPARRHARVRGDHISGGHCPGQGDAHSDKCCNWYQRPYRHSNCHQHI